MGWKIIIALLVIAVIAATIAAVYQNYKTRSILNHINDMIESAINGNFTEQIIDESMLSEVECKMAKYLSASELSAKNVAEEKKLLHELISDISHQTKTPLANIKLYAELLKEVDLQDEHKDNLIQLYDQTEKLEFLIQALVEMSRLETGILKLEPKEGTVNDILSSIEKQYSNIAREKNLEFTIERSDVIAVFDEKWTIEAIGNIVDNAIKYTDRGHVAITVKSYEMFQCIEVSDTGKGIEESEQGTIFKRFHRSKDVSTREGLGLGLYLAREIIRRQNGYIKVVSKKGEGSIFQVYLPARDKFFQNR